MNWITSHLDLLIGVAAAIAYALNHLRQEAKRKSKTDRPSAPGGAGSPRQPARRMDAEAEQTRRIREEILRKQQERAAGKPARVPEPALEPPPLFRRPNSATRPVAPMPLPRLRNPEPPLPPAPAKAREATGVEAKADWKAQRDREQLARLLQQTAWAARPSPSPVPAEGTEQSSPWRAELLRDLRQPGSVRRAIVLSEVLAPPVGMR